ncbi:MAG TPA: aspartyl protease family protein [Candidatus Baltobacteraceae bacterium]|nr:aspartyl protease family protein [Candidatus Baltobacteraceae bacterium]
MRIWVLASMMLAGFGISRAQAAETYLPSALTPQQVFAKARAARGHLTPGSYHSVSERTHGSSALRIDVFENGKNYVETDREGTDTWSSGSYNGTDWEQDENGVVTLLSESDADANPFTAALSRPPGQDSSTRVLGITASQPACVVVQVVPKPGLVQQRYYDAKTFLLRRVVTADYQNRPWTYTYDGYRTQYGLTYAQTIAYDDGHPENASVTQSKAFEPVAASQVHAEIPKSRPLFELPGDTPVTVPAEFTPDGIIVRVTIAGRGLDFKLDSGAGDIVLDAGVARELGLPVTDTYKGSFSGDYTEGISHAPDLSIGALHGKNVVITLISGDQLVGERKVVGLLGGDFFASERVWVNFQNHTLTISPSSAAAPSGTWSAIPIDVDGHVARAHAKFNAVDGAFTVDLGADNTMLYPHFFAQFHPDRKGEVIGEVEGVAGEDVDFRQYVFSRFDFGDFAFSGANVWVTSGTKFEELDNDGLLGRNILENFNLVFDYPSGKLYVQSLVQ